MLNALLQQKKEIEQQMADLQATIEPGLAQLRDQITTINSQITAATSEKLAELRKLQAKEYGVVHLVLDGVKVSETVSKKVEWDQEKLTGIYDKIVAHGDNPRNYMKVELKVGEKEFEKFAAPIKSIFAEARTVKPGPPSVKYEEVEA